MKLDRVELGRVKLGRVKLGIMNRRRRRSLVVIDEGSWRDVGRWNARAEDRIGEDLAGL